MIAQVSLKFCPRNRVIDMGVTGAYLHGIEHSVANNRICSRFWQR